MHYRYLGQTGVKVSVFSYGSWLTFSQMTDTAIIELLSYAIDHGINLIDTAEIYGGGQVEATLGSALKKIAVPREQLLISSKVFWGGAKPTECGLSRKHIIEGCNQSLKRLQVDYLDYYSCHRPDPHTSIEETVIAMNLLIQQGKILYWGTSEWPVDLILEAYHTAKQLHLIPPSVEQFEYNLFARLKGDHDFPTIKKKTNIGAMVTMPLACGILAGRYNDAIPADSRSNLPGQQWLRDSLQSKDGQHKITIAKQLAILANDHHLTLSQLSLYWCLANSHITTIILGTTKLSQLADNLKVINMLDNGTVTMKLVDQIEQIINNKPPLLYEPSYAEVLAES